MELRKMSSENVDIEGNGVVSVPPFLAKVNHGAKLLDCFKSSVLLNGEYADVYLVVEGVRLPAHKSILAARSEYFRALLLKMKESNVNQVELEGASIAGMKVLLEYLYTGQVSLGDIPEDVLWHVLGLCHEYQGGFEDLVESICNYLNAALHMGNVCQILDTALSFGLHSLVSSCCTFGDANVAGITKLISRDSFSAREEDIFNSVATWIRHNENVHQDTVLKRMLTVLKNVRLPLMTTLTLIERVKPTGLVSSDAIFDAIVLREKGCELKHRGRLLPEENVALNKHGATIANVLSVTRGEAILDGDVENYDNTKGYGYHTIDMSGNEGIVIKLGEQFILNHIRLLLWDKDLRSYSYYVEVSVDEKHWVRICNHAKYHCRSWQNIFFMQRVVRFIRVVGTHNTANQSFHLVQVEAFFTMKEFSICPEFGLLCPKENVSTVQLGARVIEGIGTNVNVLIDVIPEGSDRTPGYTFHEVPDGAIVVQLAQAYVISSMRLRLWDGDDRSYSYRIEVSTDKSGWEMVWDMSKERCKSWQTIRFSPIPVVYIRIVGTSSGNFYCVRLECPAPIIDSDEDMTRDVNTGSTV